MTLWYPDPVAEDNLPLKSEELEGEQVPVHRALLEQEVSDNIEAIKGHVDGVETALTTLIGHVDGLEALGTALNGFVDGVETLLGTTNTALTALQGYVDGLEGYTDTLETKLDALHTDLSPPAAYYEGTKNVTTAGTRVALASSQALTKGVWIFAKEANVGLVYVGGSNVSSSAGARLVPGAPFWMDCANLANVYLDSANNSDGVTYLAW